MIIINYYLHGHSEALWLSDYNNFEGINKKSL